MLKKILSISGKSGLFRLVSHGKNMIIVESLKDKKRTPAYASNKIVALGDISMYTYGEDIPLSQVFQNVYDKYEGKALNADDYTTAEQLAEFFEGVLPEYDQDRVYKTDIKRVITWYNALIESGFTKFVEEEAEAAEAEESK